jgi:hypothetical protein
MALVTNQRDHMINVINEYLDVANVCLKVRPARGYPAVFLLLNAIDAIGHCVMPDEEWNWEEEITRLDVLAHPIFGAVLTVKQADLVENWFLRPLRHLAIMAPNALLDLNGSEPFEFDENGHPTLIRVERLYELVKQVWDNLDKDTLNPPEMYDK